jgi:hypothetical protein
MEQSRETQKQAMRQQALRQKQLEELTERNLEINSELTTLLSSNEKKRTYVLLAGLAGVFIYFLLIILVISILQTGSLSLVYTYFLGWTICFTLATIGLCIPLFKIRKFNKAIKAQVKAYRAEIERNTRIIHELQNK